MRKTTALLWVRIIIKFIVYTFCLIIGCILLITNIFVISAPSESVSQIVFWTAISGNSILWIYFIRLLQRMSDKNEISKLTMVYGVFISSSNILMGICNIVLLNKISIGFGILISLCFLITMMYITIYTFGQYIKILRTKQAT